MSDDFEKALEAVAKARRMTVDALKQEMLATALGGERREEPTRSLARSGSGDASGASLAQSRREAIDRHQSREYPGSPVVRYDRDDHETAEEAQERWYESEAELPDGVHGLGGSTAGGIFGDGPIATNIYDPGAMGRTNQQVSQTANIKMLGLIERLTNRLEQYERPAELPDGSRSRGALPGAAARRLGRGSSR